MYLLYIYMYIYILTLYWFNWQYKIHTKFVAIHQSKEWTRKTTHMPNIIMELTPLLKIMLHCWRSNATVKAFDNTILWICSRGEPGPVYYPVSMFCALYSLCKWSSNGNYSLTYWNMKVRSMYIFYTLWLFNIQLYHNIFSGIIGAFKINILWVFFFNIHVDFLFSSQVT